MGYSSLIGGYKEEEEESVHVEWAYIFTARAQSSQDVTPTNKLIIAASFPAQIGVL